MRIRRTLGLGSLLVALVPALAAGQETRTVGITMGYPAALGVLWHVSDKVAIRPELTFGGTSTTTTSSSFDNEGNGWTVGTGVSAIFYLGSPADKLRTYVAPRFTYAHMSSTVKLSSVTNSSTTTTGNGVGGFGLFGAQYAVGDRFTVFGEVAFGLTHSSTTSSLLPTKGSGNSWGIHSGAGIVFYP